MIKEEINPDIELKYDQLLVHMNEKNGILTEFINILKEICDAEIFYSRTMDKFANNISKLMIGKDPLKEVFIIFQRLIGAKSQQSMQMSTSIKQDMIPFIQKEAMDIKQQNQLRSKQKVVKDLKVNIQRKLRNLHASESSYKRAYEMLKKTSIVETRAQLQQRQRQQKLFNQRESILIQSINSYNHTVQQYLLNYSGICQRLSDIQTKRKLVVRDAINKFMIYQISCIKNIEYNVPRYMQSLGKMNDRLVIMDKMILAENHDSITNIAKISINNYICSLNDRDKIEIPNSHRKILELKKNVENNLTQERYHEVTKEIYKILDEVMVTYDVRALKEIVYFSRNVFTTVVLPDEKKETDIEEILKKGKGFVMLLLDSVMCHAIFRNNQFWSKYQIKLFEIIQKQSKLSAADTNNKEIQISLSFLAADLQFLRIVSFHQLPSNILSKFTIVQPNKSQMSQTPKKNIQQTLDPKILDLIDKHSKYF